MGFDVRGFKTLTHIGTIDGTVGSNRAQHAYVTNDDAAAVQTAGYFNPVRARLKKGDQIIASLEIDETTPKGRLYVVTATSGTNVTVAPFQATAIA